MKRYCIVPKNQQSFWSTLDQREIPFEQRRILQEAKIKHVEVIPDESAWEIVVHTRERLPQDLLSNLAAQLCSKCRLERVYFQQSVVSLDLYLHAKWNELAAKVAGDHPLLFYMLQHARRRFDGSNLYLEVMGGVAAKLLETHEVKRRLQEFLADECGVECRVEFIIGEAAEVDMKKAIMTTEYMEALHTAPKREPSAAQSASGAPSGTRARGGEVSPPRRRRSHMGDAIPEAPEPIGSVQEEANHVVFRGRIVHMEIRELRSGRSMLTFDLGDLTDGISCKAFFDNAAQAAESTKNIKDGMTIKVKGNLKFDTYANELVMFVDNLLGAAAKERLDTAEIKRVELHAHTHMSNMDAVVSASTLIQTAAKWQHPAIAITDHGVVQSFPEAMKAAKKHKIKVIYGMEGYLVENGKSLDKAYHIILLAKNPIGLRNLYQMVSLSHLKYLHRTPRLPRKIISEYREGIIVGSACEAGELIRAIVDKRSDEELFKIAGFYDYLEIQPIGNNEFLVRKDFVKNDEALRDINRKVAELAKKLKKPLVATCDVHFLNPEDEIYRRILMTGKGYQDAEHQPPLFFRTTEEMLDEFSYLGEEEARAAVVENPRRIADSIAAFDPLPDEEKLYSPQIPGAEEQIKQMSYSRAKKLYGENLPKLVSDRLEMELRSIIGHGYAVLYLIAHKLVKKSLDDGYLVGSRGSVGSSFVAHMTEITEVNALPPHWRCPSCQFSEFITDGSVGCGFDLPDKNCPNCGALLIKDGHDIPFAVFMGFNGDKVPDIDLNFSGDYQAIAHKYTEELFGKDNVFKAGTIGSVADKTAYGYIKRYFADKNIPVRNAFVNTLVDGCTGVKRTTGQHPGGIMVIPRNMDVHYFTPIQHPADDKNSTIITTHFDYHSISGRLVKLDILGHDDPTMIKMLEDLTGRDPKTIPFDDPETMSLFSSTEALGVAPEELGSPTGTYGVPEYGTKFVRQMLEDTKPKTFAELLRISGFSHGTNVWLDNAQELIRSGTAKVSEAISTRDDIMNYLIQKGVQPLLAFKTMEKVRKGRGIEPDVIEKLKAADVPDWFIDSCLKIKYLFPKAHAVAYVMMAYRIAYCKVHYPLAYYAAYFTVRADEFDAGLIARGKKVVAQAIDEISRKGNDASVKEKGLLTVLEIALEMYLRGFSMRKVDLYKSAATKFIIEGDALLPPLGGLPGVGASAAQNIVAARAKGEFSSVEDLKNRAGISRLAVDTLREVGCLEGMAETAQIELFD